MHMDDCREALLAAGFTEATVLKNHFYRRDTEWTAFAVNLKEEKDSLVIEYGWASTAFVRMDGPDALEHFGCTDINLHEQLRIPRSANPAPFAAQVRTLYTSHYGQEKETLLLTVQAKRKAFLASIAARLKPLGFRKKASTWTRPLDENRLLTLHVQKSAYSDAYYFNLALFPAAPLTLQPLGCCSLRVKLDGADCLDWQSLGDQAMQTFLDEALLPAIHLWMDTPVSQLRREGSMGLLCVRERCQHCWLEEKED